MTAREWYALLGGHVAWSLHLMVSYALAARACAAPGGDTPELVALRHVTTVIATLATATAIVASLPGWRRARAETTEAATTSAGVSVQRRFLQGLALPINILFLVGVVAAGAGNVLLPPCA